MVHSCKDTAITFLSVCGSPVLMAVGFSPVKEDTNDVTAASFVVTFTMQVVHIFSSLATDNKNTCTDYGDRFILLELNV